MKLAHVKKAGTPTGPNLLAVLHSFGQHKFKVFSVNILLRWLVVTGTMEFYDFPETVGNVIIPTDELHHFSEG